MSEKNNSLQGAFILLLLLFVGYLLTDKFLFQAKQTGENTRLIHYLDSINQKNELLYAKVDSLQKVKTQLYSEYTKVKLKYDTIQIAIDTMPDLEGTKLLFSISRQLTAKGIE